MSFVLDPIVPPRIGDHAHRNSRGGLHTMTQEIPRFRQPGFLPGATELFKKLRGAELIEPKIPSTPRQGKPSKRPSMWRKRFADAFRWFGLTATYLSLSFVLMVMGMLMVKGGVLLWDGWISGLGQ